MSGLRADWFLCGGWAVDAWLGRQTREHKDVDIAVFEDGLPALLAHLGGWQLLAHDAVEPDSAEQWDGRPLELPAHVHARKADDELNFQVIQRSGPVWLLSREPRITIDVTRGARASAEGLPTLSPKVLLFFKAQELRPQDGTDFVALLPHLAVHQTRWLQEALTLIRQEHPWLARLSPGVT